MRQADNGFWYIHFSKNGRSRRFSTKTRDEKVAARIFLAYAERKAAATGGETCEVPAELEEPLYEPVSLKREKNGFWYIHHRGRNDSKETTSTKTDHLIFAEIALAVWLIQKHAKQIFVTNMLEHAMAANTGTSSQDIGEMAKRNWENYIKSITKFIE